MKTYVVITVVLLLCFLASSCGGTDSGGAPAGVATADLGTVTERWDALSEQERDAVCRNAPPSPGKDARPDYRGMLSALMNTGIKQEDATAMLPYAVNQCT